MATRPKTRAKASSGSTSTTFEVLRPSFQRSLLAQNKSPKTVKTFGGIGPLSQRFLVPQGMPQAVSSIRCEHPESFIADLLARWKPNTANNRYRGLQQFFKWCEEEGEVKESPMARMKPPKVPEESPPIRSEHELSRLPTASEGTTFRDRRDMALVTLSLDTSARRSELAF